MALRYGEDDPRLLRGFEEIDQPAFDPGQAPTIIAQGSSFTGEVSPEAFTADQNNLTLSDGHSFRFSTNGVARTITGFANVRAGRVVYIQNVAGGANISLANQSGSSTEQNRIITGTGGTVAIQPDRGAILLYDGRTTRWRLIAMT